MSTAESPGLEFTKASTVPQLGLATASLVLGIVACVLSLFVVGALFGLIGLVLGLSHVFQKRGPNGMAWWGIGLSIFSILAGVAMGVVFYHLVTAQMKKVTTANSAFTQWIGAEAPDIAITTLDGKSIRLSRLKGKRVVLDFWATWCGPCIREMPHFERLYKESSRDELIIIGISNEDETTVRSFVAQKGVHYPIAVSKGLPSPYRDIQAIPTTFFIDRNGIVQSVITGFRDFSELKDRALAADFPEAVKSAQATPPLIPDRTGSAGSLHSADLWVGVWKSNPAKSQLLSAPEPDISETLVICREIDPDSMELAGTQIRKDGSKVVNWKCTVAKNGGMQRYQRGAPQGGIAIVKTVIDSHAQYLTYLRDGKQIQLAILVLSNDGKTYTMTENYKDAGGQAFQQVEVYEKQ